MSKILDSSITPSQTKVDLNNQNRSTGSRRDDRNLEKEADDFASKLKEKDEKQKDGGDHKEKAGEKNQPRSPGSAILDSMQTQIKGSGIKAGAQEAGLSQTINEIVDKLLVSDSSLSGKDEIRLSLKDSILPGTEVRISKESSGIKIEMVTTSDQSFQLLASEKSALESNLKDRLKDNVSVELRFNESGQEDNEGRSRQQRNIIEEQDE